MTRRAVAADDQYVPLAPRPRPWPHIPGGVVALANPGRGVIELLNGERRVIGEVSVGEVVRLAEDLDDANHVLAGTDIQWPTVQLPTLEGDRPPTLVPPSVPRPRSRRSDCGSRAVRACAIPERQAIGIVTAADRLVGEMDPVESMMLCRDLRRAVLSLASPGFVAPDLTV